MNFPVHPETTADGYKVDHRSQYPKNTQIVASNATPRSTRRGPGHDKVVYIGGQYFVERFLIQEWNMNFFSRPKEEVVQRFTKLINAYLGSVGAERVGTAHIEALHDLGYLPIELWTLPEGTVYPLKVPCLVIWNTIDDFFWLTNYLETLLSTTIWGMCTSATTALNYKKLLNYYAKLTTGSVDFVMYQGHDFSFRGMFGYEAACMSGFAHLTSFYGTDTIPAITFAEHYYGADLEKEVVGVSVAATEHSVMCAGGKENEELTVIRLLKEVYPTGIVSVVLDTWDFWAVVRPNDGMLARNKALIMGRDGKLVVRPDTGDPVKIVTGEAYPVRDITPQTIREALSLGYKHLRRGNTYHEIQHTAQGVRVIALQADEVTPAMKGAMQCLYETFGGTITKQGYIMLDSHIGLIYGDSITEARCEAICRLLEVMGFASTNIVYGIGSFTYGYVTRDTDGYAIKATWVKVNNEPREIFKDPATGDGTKKSAKGLTAVFQNPDGTYYLKDQATWDEVRNCCFVPIFKDGKFITKTSLKQIRETIAKHSD